MFCNKNSDQCGPSAWTKSICIDKTWGKLDWAMLGLDFTKLKFVKLINLRLKMIEMDSISTKRHTIFAHSCIDYGLSVSFLQL